MTTAFEYQMDYLGSAPMTWDQFLERHRKHEIVECDDNEVLPMPMSLEELEQRIGGNAEVEYLGEDSPFYLDNDGLFFVVRPLTRKGTVNKRRQFHVVVYVV